jgi:hypothetical protein
MTGFHENSNVTGTGSLWPEGAKCSLLEIAEKADVRAH